MPEWATVVSYWIAVAGKFAIHRTCHHQLVRVDICSKHRVDPAITGCLVAVRELAEDQEHMTYACSDW